MSAYRKIEKYQCWIQICGLQPISRPKSKTGIAALQSFTAAHRQTATGRHLPVANLPVSSHSPMEQAFIWIGIGHFQRAGQDEQHDGQQLPAQRSMLTSARIRKKNSVRPEPYAVG